MAGIGRRARPRSALPPRSLRRDSQGALYDVEERRPVSTEELRDDVRSGRRFRAHRHDTGADCTYEVLVVVLTSALPAWNLPLEGRVGTTLDTIWHDLYIAFNAPPKGFRDRGPHRRAGDTPESHGGSGEEASRDSTTPS
ncbi:MAG: hypothetical protein ACRD0K_04365 [Egibacteraceae bacterium]